MQIGNTQQGLNICCIMYTMIMSTIILLFYNRYVGEVKINIQSHINIGYTMEPRGLRDLEPSINHIDTRVQNARVSIGFQGDLNPVGPSVSSYKVFILYREWPMKSMLMIATKLASNSN